MASLVVGAKLFKGKPLSEKLKKSVEKAAGHIWDRGILKKGFGICHGITGNAACLLNYYKLTNDKQVLYQVYSMMNLKKDEEVVKQLKDYKDPSRMSKGSADFPYSLMEGLAGDILMQIESLVPEIMRFPGYEV
mmetsp:Transcript_35364/g.31834  ORF Transcript_35364/g.31834 Transcript_35364/m.31834 type:complete len:134 (+) Transcript_35364:506-907(+)